MLEPSADFRAVSDFAIKNRCPAVVVAPEFAPMMLVDKSAKGGQFRLIAAIDFPEGKNFCLDKFKTLDIMSLEVDGMDILMTKGRTEIEASNEAKTLVEFIRGSVNPVSDIRFTLGYYTKEWPEVENLLKAAKANPPDAIRVDQHLLLPNVNAKTHTQSIKRLRTLTPKPLKISGNIDLPMMEHLLRIDQKLKFDVSIQQAMHIVNQIKQREAAVEKRNV
jgi:hypothetical protein